MNANLILIASLLFVFSLESLIALIIGSVKSKRAKKMQRLQRKAEHQVQAYADMEAMKKVYYENLFNRIMKGN